MQLSYTGKQDVILSGNPQHNFFKCVFKRYLNFSIEPIQQQVINIPNFGNSITIRVKRAGDMLSKVYLELKLPALAPTSGTYAGWANSIGNLVISEVEMYIGGILITKTYGEFMEIEDEHISSESKRISKNLMLGRFEDLVGLQSNATSETIYTIPLNLWFCKFPELALPLVELQYHDIDMRITFRPFNECLVFDGVTGPTPVDFVSCTVWGDYIFFDDQIRKRMAKNNSNYLIEQIQRSSVSSELSGVSVFRKEIQFNHPVKYLMWFYREVNSETNNDWFNFSARADGGKIANSTIIQVNGQELHSERDESYYRLTQPNRHFTRSPLKYLYSYCFASKPEEYQPSGAFNFSRVSSSCITSQVRSTVATTNSKTVYAVNHNVLVFRNGMAALLWSS